VAQFSTIKAFIIGKESLQVMGRVTEQHRFLHLLVFLRWLDRLSLPFATGSSCMRTDSSFAS